MGPMTRAGESNVRYNAEFTAGHKLGKKSELSSTYGTFTPPSLCSKWLRCGTLLADRRDRHSWASSGLPVNRRLLWARGAARWVICIDDLLIAFIWAARRAIDRERAIALRRGRGFHTIYSASHRRMASNNRESCFAPSCPATHVVSGAARSF